MRCHGDDPISTYAIATFDPPHERSDKLSGLAWRAQTREMIEMHLNPRTSLTLAARGRN